MCPTPSASGVMVALMGCTAKMVSFSTMHTRPRVSLMNACVAFRDGDSVTVEVF